MTISRRDMLTIGAAGALVAPFGGAGRARAQFAPPPPIPPVDLQRFTMESVVAMARDLSRKPFVAPQADLPAPFSGLSYEQYVGIRARPGSALWAFDGLPFQIELLHRGAMFSQQVGMFVVENGLARPLGYDPAAFEFGKLAVPSRLPSLGFSGLRVLRTRPDGPPLECALVQGATSIRAMARGQNFGVISRALAIRTADPRGEEIPFFRSIWIERPGVAATALVFTALLDSESATGAFRFTLRPGDVTVTDVEATLFPRVALDNVGLAPMQGTSLFGPLDRRRFDDIRPAVYETSGLSMRTGADEWLWRPVSNRESLQISAFVDRDPKGFGLVQREREFERFFDDDQHWELRPSLWIEPIGEWGEGAVQLAEIPAEAEANDNIIAYWRPKAALAAGSEHSFAYRQLWCWDPPDPPQLAVATQSRSGRAGGRRRRFIVEFTGAVFGEPMSELRADVTVNPGQLTSLRSFLVRDRKRMRVVFDIDPGGEDSSEIRLVILGDGKPVSETWLYRWTP
jgi:glucans biosynthesis protein